MRQLCTLESESAARTLAAYLITQRIVAHAEGEAAGHTVWVRDEDQLESARAILLQFQANPGDARFQGAERTAEKFLRDEAQAMRRKQSNVVEMRGKWGSGTGALSAQRCPVVLGMIAISILVAILTFNREGASTSTVRNLLLFVDPAVFRPPYPSVEPTFFTSIGSGQVWRLVTPIFIHYGLSHIIFNVWLLYVLGGQIENRRGSLRFFLLVLALAIVSNVGEAIASQLKLPEVFAMFGGLSGVGYGILGYLWMKVKFDNSAGFVLARETVFIGIAWFLLCILRDIPPFASLLSGLLPDGIANTAHAVGLFAGMAIGYAPVLFRSRA